ncbi:MAG: hypothetical protein KME07_15140 [Pegethrix bostrychoides GSE-TBD4-15B]|uniref:Uncharacterized protein n=1 Tax=Pegethrix bostrychoides GSE-TBD4-15B TaxID=2839662 RepID=A0A951PD23_9CYAN|nr:hypothetical protein [Pegethrix bostrychoides GSE-TBD4-15B]
MISSDWNLISKAGDLAYLPHCSPVCVRLDVEDLPCFTVVNRQYEAWGVRFENAVAIHPSNPLYPPYSGEMVLLGAPRDGWLEARFLHPVRHVGSCVVSSRRTVIQAFNRQNQLVAEAAAEANLGQGNTSLRLSSAAQNIHRVTLECFDGQLTVDDFCFCS